MAKKDNDKRQGIVYSTDPDFNYQYNEEEEAETLEPGKQMLKIYIDKSGRKGKEMTAIEGFIGKTEDIVELGKKLKQHCGTGGTVKDNLILIQGDFREKVSLFLEKAGYRVRRK